MKFVFKIIKFISYIPLVNKLLILIYHAAKNKLRAQLSELENIEDIIIISDFTSGQFIFGQSDYNLLIITKNPKRMKTILRRARYLIRSHPLTSLVFNYNYIPILTKEEFNTNFIKSYILQNYTQKMITWDSLLFHKKYKLQAPIENIYPMLHFAFKNLDSFLFRKNTFFSKRNQLKKLMRSLNSLNYFFPELYPLPDNFQKKFRFISSYPLLAFWFHQKIERFIWKSLTYHEIKTKPHVEEQESLPIPDILEKVLTQLKQNPWIDDIMITPALINPQQAFLEKIYIDILVNKDFAKQRPLKLKENMRELIKAQQNEDLKIRLRVLPSFHYVFFNQNYLYAFPLDPMLRDKLAYSINDKMPSIDYNSQQLDHALIHFFLTQVIRFRSLDQKTALIGSKFIKALNLMYRYYQVLYYLKNKDILVLRAEEDIREKLSPQFSHILSSDIVTDETWILIRSQLLFLLKNIKQELVKREPKIERVRL
ncbi:MAG: hypothetical protein CME62_09905 [Halobacteriovoraceae bacterium]|nr:hypothetical protein [Halobacteriovoraceae bacterium]|tara:strand:+ start:15310 stop:16755 length:1446 start_codon:yes stop_codon:yes gene_type:complete